MAAPTSINANINAITRDIVKRTIKDQVHYKIPVLTLLELRKQVVPGGLSISQPVSKALRDDQVQNYTANEGMNATRKTTLDRPHFVTKNMQIPMMYDMDDLMENISGDSESQLIDYSAHLVKEAMESLRARIAKEFYGMGTTAAGLYDSIDAKTPGVGAHMQSLRQALTHDLTYGGLSRATTVTNSWWQGASIDGTYTDWNTPAVISVNFLRQMKQACLRTSPGTMPKDLKVIVGDANFLALQTEVESKHIYNRDGSELAKFGFNTMMIDGMEIINDSMLSATNATNANQWVFMLNLNDWEFRINRRRNFQIQPFTDQGDIAGGLDAYLGRIKLGANLVCWKPNGSCFRSAVSAA